MKGSSSRTKVLTKRLSLFVTLLSAIFLLWVAYATAIVAWVAYIKQDEDCFGSYQAVFYGLNDTNKTNGTHLADLQGVPMEAFTLELRWTAFWSTAVLLVIWIVSFCIRGSKKNSLEMNILGDVSVKAFLASISKIFAAMIVLMLLIGVSMIVTWLVLLKNSAYDPGSYRASVPWTAVNGETYQGLTLPSVCPDPHVALGVYLIGNNPSLWPSSACTTLYKDRITTYFCCFVIEEVQKPVFSDHLYEFVLFGGIAWTGLSILCLVFFSCTTWWKRQAVGSV